jgi:cobalamin biosynthesis Mg chelatase CobN
MVGEERWVTDGARAARMRAGAAVVLLAILAVVLVPSPGAVGAEPCVPDVTCETTTTAEPTTTTAVTTTTTEATTSTTARQTTTTARQTATTRAQATTTTTVEPVTTANNVLVPGDGTEGAQSTTTTVATVAAVSDDGPSDATLIALVIAGLLLIALVVAVLTWRYWVATRPPLLEEPERSRSGGGSAPVR